MHRRHINIDMMSIYRQVAGVGSTIDDMREYLLVLYAQAYDALDRHFLLGGELETKSTPQDIDMVSKHFDNMITIAQKAGDAKVARILRRLKNATVKYMKGKLTAKQFVRVLRQLIREYGIPTTELRRIEERIDRIEAEIRARERARRSVNVFKALNRFSEKLFAPPKPVRARKRARAAHPFAALDRLFDALTRPLRRRRR